jgi:hypothetical protein
MSVDRTSVGLSENESVPPSEYQDSSEGLGGIGSDIDDGDEAGWARERDKEKVGRGLGNLSKVSSPNWGDFRLRELTVTSFGRSILLLASSTLMLLALFLCAQPSPKTRSRSPTSASATSPRSFKLTLANYSRQPSFDTSLCSHLGRT